MDEKTQEILQLGRDYIANLDNEGLDYTPDSIRVIEDALSYLKEKLPQGEYPEGAALISFAVYVGDVIQQQFTDVEFEVVFQGESVDQINLVSKNEQGFYLLTWVLKCYDDPAGDSLVGKYLFAMNYLSNPEMLEEEKES